MLAMFAMFSPLSIDIYLPAMPIIEQQLNTNITQVQLSLSMFLFGLALGQLLYGPLSDHYGRRWVLISGLVLYVVAGVFCALAASIEELILFRFLQAFGGGAGVVIARAIVRDLFQGNEMARAFSIISALTMLAPILAPVLGGNLVVWTGWRSIFWLLNVFGLICLLLAIFMFEESLPKDRRQRLTPLQACLGYIDVFRNSRATGYILCNFLGFGALFSFIADSPFVFMNIYGVRADHFGYYFGGICIGLTMLIMVSSRLTTAWGYQKMLARSLALRLVASVLLFCVTALGLGGLAGFIIMLFVTMSPTIVIFATSTSGALHYFPEKAGTASAAMGASGFAMAGLTGVLIGFLHDGTARPMAGLIFFFSLLSFISYWSLIGNKTD